METYDTEQRREEEEVRVVPDEGMTYDVIGTLNNCFSHSRQAGLSNCDIIQSRPWNTFRVFTLKFALCRSDLCVTTAPSLWFLSVSRKCGGGSHHGGLRVDPRGVQSGRQCPKKTTKGMGRLHDEVRNDCLPYSDLVTTCSTYPLIIRGMSL